MSYFHKVGKGRWFVRLASHFPPGQFGRFLVVGLCNTFFAYAAYAALTALLTPHMPLAYLAAAVVAGVTNITFSFMTYKLLVFRTKGNYLREWSRCMVVYSGTALVSTALLPITVFLLRHFSPVDRSAPYIAGAIQIGAGAVAGFLGHRNFSFAPPREIAEHESH